MRSIVCSLLLGLPVASADLTVHEWGTFTAVSGSDGALLTGLEVEEERLPNIVHSHAGFAPFTDGVLPITIRPRPVNLERVLVGRTEVLTPTFEAQLRRDFAADGGARWASDRYFRAYRERVRQLGGVVDIAPPRPTR